jgi:hypothetical protein
MKIFHDSFGGDRIGLLWDPSVKSSRPFRVLGGYSSSPSCRQVGLIIYGCARLLNRVYQEESRSGKDKTNISLNETGVLAEIERMGSGLIDHIIVQDWLLGVRNPVRMRLLYVIIHACSGFHVYAKHVCLSLASLEPAAAPSTDKPNRTCRTGVYYSVSATNDIQDKRVVVTTITIDHYDDLPFLSALVAYCSSAPGAVKHACVDITCSILPPDRSC